MAQNPLLELESLGQSVWLDLLNRDLLASGRLARLVEEDGVSGVTSNPKIFADSIAGSDAYDDEIRSQLEQGLGLEEVYEVLAIEDVKRAADVLRPVYNRTGGEDGFVSLEVSPHLAFDSEGTIRQARRFWLKVDRPNLLVKVPGTSEGVPAIRQLLTEGINVNVTLLFGLDRYWEVAQAYVEALEARVAAADNPVHAVASVASFFLSRIDVLVDPQLEEIMKQGGRKAEAAGALHGRVAIASAKTAYKLYQGIFESGRFRKLRERGARPQRLLWASTSTKNPSYSDVMYVESLIGPRTINTMPMETIDAYRDHGRPAARIEEGIRDAEQVFGRLAELGIDPNAISRQLEAEGVRKFADPYDALLEKLQQKRSVLQI